MGAKHDSVPLREHLEAHIEAVEKAAIARADAQDKAVEAAFASHQAAVQKTETASEKRFESVNEFRQTLSDQARTFMPRIESERMHASALDRHNMADKAMSERVERLTLRMTAYDERGAGKQIGWSTVISVIALVASVVGILAYLLKGTS